MWLLVPRSRRRAGFGALSRNVGLSLLAVTLAWLSGCIHPDGAGQRRQHHGPHPSGSLSLSSPPTAKGPAGGLAIGLTETNPYLLAPSSQAVPAAFAPARSLLDAIDPRYLRLDIDWAALEPLPGGDGSGGAASGCARRVGPCAAYAGLGAQLRVLAARQRAAERSHQAPPTVIIVIYGAPSWASSPADGCRAGGGRVARPLTSRGLVAYRHLLTELVALERRVGARIRWWSPWNEPNSQLMLSPQRASCSDASPSLAPAAYAELARTLADVLRRAPGGPRELVLGDLADVPAPQPGSTSIGEFVAALPADVLCSATVWAQHDYPGGVGPLYGASGRADDVSLLERALDRRGRCGGRARIWVTETGVGAQHLAGVSRRQSPRRACQLLAQALLAWYRDPRVDVAFQYTFREDPLFPVGLLSADLARVYPSYSLLRAWADRPPTAPPPAQGAVCPPS